MITCQQFIPELTRTLKDTVTLKWPAEKVKTMAQQKLKNESVNAVLQQRWTVGIYVRISYRKTKSSWTSDAYGSEQFSFTCGQSSNQSALAWF